MTHVLIVVRRGVNELAVTGTEADLKQRFSDVTWQNFGYKQSAHVTDQVMYDLFLMA